MKTAGRSVTNLMFPVASAKLMPASASLSLADGPRKGAITIRLKLLPDPSISWLWGRRVRYHRSNSKLTSLASTGLAFTSTMMVVESP